MTYPLSNPTLPVLLATVCSDKRKTKKKFVRRRRAWLQYFSACAADDRAKQKWLWPYLKTLTQKSDRESALLGAATTAQNSVPLWRQ